MIGIIALFLMQMMFLVFMLIIVWLTTGSQTQQYNRFVRFEAIEDICRSCREITDRGEVDYFTYGDIEIIVEKLRYKKVVIESDIGFRAKKFLLAIPVFMFTGFLGVVLFIIYYKNNRFKLVNGNLELQNLRVHTLDWALDKFRALADGGEINYFSIEDIENIAGELRHELTTQGMY